jgi:Terpene synthase family 2, C-terminal metal binding
LLHTGAPGAQQRFIEAFDFFFQAVTQQAQDRHSNDIPDLESYITLRRETSGCKLCWALIEYANNLDIPDEVMEHPLIRSLGNAANDYVSWSNVSIFLCEKNGTHLMSIQIGSFLLQCRASERGYSQYDLSGHEPRKSGPPTRRRLRRRPL